MTRVAMRKEHVLAVLSYSPPGAVSGIISIVNAGVSVKS